MHTEISKITSKGQTTIPASLRKALNLMPGDDVIFMQDGNTLLLKKAMPLDIMYYRSLQSDFSNEWDSEEDHEAYNDL